MVAAIFFPRTSGNPPLLYHASCTSTESFCSLWLHVAIFEVLVHKCHTVRPPSIPVERGVPRRKDVSFIPSLWLPSEILVERKNPSTIWPIHRTIRYKIKQKSLLNSKLWSGPLCCQNNNINFREQSQSRWERSSRQSCTESRRICSSTWTFRTGSGGAFFFFFFFLVRIFTWEYTWTPRKGPEPEPGWLSYNWWSF